MHATENNKVIMSNEDQEIPFQYNFINIPWDDRSKLSKIGIIALLLIIFITTMACVINFFKIQYHSYLMKGKSSNAAIRCHMVKVVDYRYVARIHLIPNLKPICVAAILSDSVVITNEDCVQSGSIILRVGSWSEPRCRKNFAVEIIDNFRRNNVIVNKLVILRTLEKINECSSVAKLGDELILNSTAYIVGRVQHGGKLLSTQPIVINKQNCTYKNEQPNSLICIKTVTKCPIIVGDLLVQDGRVFGLSSTNSRFGRQSQIISFINITTMEDLKKNIDF